MTEILKLQPGPRRNLDYDNAMQSPPILYGEASRVFGPFDLDVCASHKNHLAPRYFTEQRSCLKYNWGPFFACACGARGVISIHEDDGLHKVRREIASNTGVVRCVHEGTERIEQRMQAMQESGCQSKSTDSNRGTQSGDEGQDGGDPQQSRGDMHQVQENTASRHGSFSSQQQQNQRSGFDLPHLRQGTGENKTGRTQSGSSGEAEDTRREAEIQSERQGERKKAHCLDNGQPQTQAEATECKVPVGSEDVGGLQSPLETEMCILRQEEEVDTRSLHTAERSRVSRDGAVEHGPRVPAMQRVKGRSSPGGLVHGHTNLCPRCGLPLKASPTTAYLNPPYGEDFIGPIIRQALTEALEGRCSTLCIFPSKKSQFPWWAEYVVGAGGPGATGIITASGQGKDGRIDFHRDGGPLGNPNHASVLAWFQVGAVSKDAREYHRLPWAGTLWLPKYELRLPRLAMEMLR